METLKRQQCICAQHYNAIRYLVNQIDVIPSMVSYEEALHVRQHIGIISGFTFQRILTVILFIEEVYTIYIYIQYTYQIDKIP